MVARVPDLQAPTNVAPPSELTIAVRVFPLGRRTISRNKSNRPEQFLVFDTETTVDAAQRLTFGSYRYYRGRACKEEGLFYADDLPDDKVSILRRYVDNDDGKSSWAIGHPLKLCSRSEFANRVFYRAAFKGRSMAVCFNFPFDISRIAVNAGNARIRRNKQGEKTAEEYAGGFSFTIWPYSKNGVLRANRYRPQVRVKSIDSKRSLKSFTSPDEVDDDDALHDWIADGEDVGKGLAFRGHFLDLRTLVFALTDRGHSLASACEEFGVEHPKTIPTRHGVVTPEYIDYNRRDVLATSELLFKALDEYDKHPIDLQPTKAYSPASIGKAYLRAMGIKPILDRQPHFSKSVLGHAMAAFFGGRTECRIRKVPVPVVYLDFLSMYPTVNALMGLWNLVTARRINVIDDTADVQALLARLSTESFFTHEIWKELVGIALVEPDADVLPVRTSYDRENASWQIGVNPLSVTPQVGPLWFTIADIAASQLLTGKVPRILKAERLKAVGKQKNLARTSLRGVVEVDPANQDFFQTVIEQRKSLNTRADLTATEVSRLDLFLKILANATAYGITAEIVRHELPGKQKRDVTVYSLGDDPLSASVRAVEEPGEYCFPPLAANITGAARLLLSLLERCVSDAGGTYAMCDTDSMAVVATEKGGLVPCEGGQHRTPDGADAVLALSWEQVDAIRERFSLLNPYARDAIPGSILKLEDDNLDPKSGKQRQLWCYAISAKRYALYLRDAAGEPTLLHKGVNNKVDGWSEHGLGHLLNPLDPNIEDRDWIRQAWEIFIREGHDLPAIPPAWLNRPAVGRISVSSPFLHKAFGKLNDGKPYADTVKPFNFLLTSQVESFGHPPGVDPKKFHLVAPYQSDPRQWRKMRWLDIYSQKAYTISTSGRSGAVGVARVKTYANVFKDYRYHPEAKSLAPSGRLCERSDIGLLKRRPVIASWVALIGKESNELELVRAGLIHGADQVYSEYEQTGRNYWIEVILPILRRMPLNTLKERSGMSASALKAIRSIGKPATAHMRNRMLLERIALAWMT